jgi:single-strand DNA-binding protein
LGKDLNKVMLTGHLGQDPELRYTPQGSAVCTFRVAAGRTWTNSAGEKQEDTEWFRVVAWDKLGEICNQWLHKGDRVYIEGRLQTRKWTSEDGQDRWSTEVVASDMIMLTTKGNGQAEAEPIEQERPAARQAPVTPAQAMQRGRGAQAPLPNRTARAAGVPVGKGGPAEEDLPF